MYNEIKADYIFHCRKVSLFLLPNNFSPGSHLTTTTKMKVCFFPWLGEIDLNICRFILMTN